jgi:uncharacterized membrane protein
MFIIAKLSIRKPGSSSVLIIYNMKSCLLCQTILSFSATANGQIAISHYVCDRSYHRKNGKSQASYFDILHHVTLPWGQN